MNYRHAFHAGNFADVAQARGARSAFSCICAPSRRRFASSIPMPAPGSTISPARRRAAAANGSGGIRPAVDRADRATPARALLAPYLDIVDGLNTSGRLVSYPGSPAIVPALLRSQDRLIACETEPNAAAALARHLGGDRRSKAIAIDGWTALNAYVPPKERRGLVLIDPPFEDAGDFARLAQGLEAAHRKWASGIYLLWYPIKGARRAGRLGAAPAAHRHRQDLARRTHAWRRRAIDGPSRGLRADRRSIRPGRSPASSRSCCRTLAPSLSDAGAGTSRRRLAARAENEFATFPQAWISLIFVTLALTFRLLWGPAE